MIKNQVWKSKESKSYILKILSLNDNGTVTVTFDFGYAPKSVHHYTTSYLNEFYEYAGYESKWADDEIVVKPKTELDKAFEDLDPEKVLFGDYTKVEKVNVWKTLK